MSLNINRFIDRIKAADARNQRDLTMSMTDAKALHGDITKLLLALQEYHEKGTSADTVVEVKLTGGSF